MTRSHLMAAWGLSVAGALACGPRVDPEEALQARLAERQARLEQALAAPEDLQPDAPVARWILPARLAELSGMTLTADDRYSGNPDSPGELALPGLTARFMTFGYNGLNDATSIKLRPH
jgi:hypothetical protein